MENLPNEPETDSSEEEVEPKLKYVRIANDLLKILSSDAVSCIAVNPKFLCFGTCFGKIHVLDHQGNIVHDAAKQDNNSRHIITVNHISIDDKGEHIATCSDDGYIRISGLYSNVNNNNLNIGRAVKSIALDPNYYRPGSGQRFIVGDNKLTLFEKTFIKGLKQSLLCESEGDISAIAWTGMFVAWASCLGVRVFDLNERCSLGLIKWEQPKSMRLEEFRCNLRWANGTTLLIGWVDTIRICLIRKRSSLEISTKDLPGYIVDPISTFQTDYFVCGLAPLETDQLVVLGYPKDRDPVDNKALRPILSVLQYKTCDYVEICTDSLSLRGHKEYKCNDYHLDCLIEENQYFIVSPKDVVVASLYENDDRVQWLIDHGKFDDAMDVISTQGGKISMAAVAKLYLDHLLTAGQYENAAKLCLRAFGNNKHLWEEEVYKFVKVHQLRSVSAYLPRTNDCKLNPEVYEMVLFEYLQFDRNGFLTLIKEWPPALYNTSAVINAIHDHFNTGDDRNVLLEALAILYSHERKYEKALAMYLKLQHKDVFDLIKQHELYNVIHLMIAQLFKLDADKTINLLMEKDKIPSNVVVQQLNKHPEFLYQYLDAFDKIDNTGKYHWELVSLYSTYNRDKLLPFLRRSHNYPIQKALDVCKTKLYYPEMVYLLGRMGNSTEALSIIIHKIKNIQMAIDFCKENNDMDLWDVLINESLDSPMILTQLLDSVAGYINPEMLVNRIKLGQDIPGLKKSIIKMLTDYGLQESIQNGCNNILMIDYFNLHDKLVRIQQRGVSVTPSSVCGLCQRDILSKDSQKSTDIILFNCRHLFHETCLPDRYSADICIVCKSVNQLDEDV